MKYIIYIYIYIYIYTISDQPHLVETARNFLYNSGLGKCTRYM